MSARASIPADGSRYDLLLPLARGGMAQVFVGQKRAAAGFTRLVAIKKAHQRIARDATSRAEIIEEVRIASKIHHPHLVAVHDVEELDGELLLIMDYVEGANVSELIVAANRAGTELDARVAIRIALDCCVGLHAAHTLRDEHGQLLALIHRDVSPQNILVGLDGLSRVTDFGIAKSQRPDRMKTTGNVLKGKVAYMAPEYIEGRAADARVDIFALGVVTWEMLANQRLFRGDHESDTLHRVLHQEAPMLSSVALSLPRVLDAVVARALAKRPDERFATAQAFADALEAVARKHDLIAGAGEVGAAVERLVGQKLAERRAAVRGALVAQGVSVLNEDEVTTAVMRPRRASAENAAADAAKHDGTGATGTAMSVSRVRTSKLDPAQLELPSPAPAPPRPPTRVPRMLGVGAALVLSGGALAWGLLGGSPSAPSAPSAEPSAATLIEAREPSAGDEGEPAGDPEDPPAATSTASHPPEPSAAPVETAARTAAPAAFPTVTAASTGATKTRPPRVAPPSPPPSKYGDNPY